MMLMGIINNDNNNNDNDNNNILHYISTYSARFTAPNIHLLIYNKLEVMQWHIVDATETIICKVNNITHTFDILKFEP